MPPPREGGHQAARPSLPARAGRRDRGSGAQCGPRRRRARRPRRRRRRVLRVAGDVAARVRGASPLGWRQPGRRLPRSASVSASDGRERPDAGRPVRRRPDVGDAVLVGAEPRNGHAGLRYRAQWPASRLDDNQRVASLRGHAGHDAAVRELGHRRLPESPVRPVELGLHGAQGHRGLGVGDAGVHVGLPPPQAVRNEAQAAVALPSRLPHRDVVTTFDVPREARGDQPRPSARPVDRDLQRRHHHRRPIPRHVGVVPHCHGQPMGRRIEPGGTVEVVSFGQDRLPGVLRAGAEGHDAAPGAGPADLIGMRPSASPLS